MVEGPVIPKRIMAGGPPSDLPDTKLSYPGKPLSHRYLPTEKTRMVEEAKGVDQAILASDTPFTPIASVNYPDKNIRLGPVTNVRSRDIQPVATSGSVVLPANGSSVYEISEDLRKPLKERLSRLANQPHIQTPDDQEITQNTLAQSTATETLTSLDQASISDLDNLKKMAAEELAKRKADSSPNQTQETSITEARLPLAEETTPPQIAGAQKKSPSPFLPTTSLGNVSEDTKSLLNRAQQLENDLARLSQGITTTSQKTEHLKEAGKQLEEVSNAKIDQLVADRATLTSKVADLTQSHTKELSARKKLETKLDKLVTGYEIQLKAVMDERDNLTASKSEESARYQSIESQVGNMAAEFDQKLQRIQIEKTNLLDQINKLQSTQEKVKQKDTQISDLQKKVVQFEDEKEASTTRYEKLEALVADLGHKQAAKPVKHAAVEPMKEAPKRPEMQPQKTARVVVPQQAIGRMAPSLTTAPNVINGILKDPSGLLLPNVIIVVKDDNDQPVRALKSNKIGQFAISTPLPNGTYIMELESPDHSFDIIQVEVNGKVLPPIEIKAIS